MERRLRMVPGVSDVLVLGGKTKEFQAEIDLNRMRAFGVSIPQIINAIATNNAMSQSVNTAIGQVPGIRDPAAFNLIGQPNLVIQIGRAHV